MLSTVQSIAIYHKGNNMLWAPIKDDVGWKIFRVSKHVYQMDFYAKKQAFYVFSKILGAWEVVPQVNTCFDYQNLKFGPKKIADAKVKPRCHNFFKDPQFFIDG